MSWFLFSFSFGSICLNMRGLLTFKATQGSATSGFFKSHFQKQMNLMSTVCGRFLFGRATPLLTLSVLPFRRLAASLSPFIFMVKKMDALKGIFWASSWCGLSPSSADFAAIVCLNTARRLLTPASVTPGALDGSIRLRHLIILIWLRNKRGGLWWWDKANKINQTPHRRKQAFSVQPKLLIFRFIKSFSAGALSPIGQRPL